LAITRCPVATPTFSPEALPAAADAAVRADPEGRAAADAAAGEDSEVPAEDVAVVAVDADRFRQMAADSSATASIADADNSGGSALSNRSATPP
jgi:hypothetical protein